MNVLFGVLGGVGFFLLGMNLLTEGLKSLAGDSLRRALIRFTGTPGKAFVSGTLATLLVQSSSATTIAVIGFVSAGLLSFPQALGVIFGASLGTTGTSWLVAWVGLKFKMGLYALPLIGLGAFLRLLGRRSWRELGAILAGFALIFIGIDTLQQGMQVLAGQVNLAELPAHGLVAHFTVVLMGILLTVIMQSSSAAIATTLTALSVHAINFEQASSLVIGAAIGTTVTGALAAIGAGVPARRTALAHILFNLATGIIALLLLPLFLSGLEQIRQVWGWKDETISLAAFHTGFIALGVILFLPLVHRFSRMIETLIPDTGPSLTRHLDRTLQATPAVALEATRMALRETLLEMIRCLSTGLTMGHWSPQREEIEEAIRRIQEFLDSLHAHPDDVALTRSRWEQVHAVDHLWRLSSRLKPGASVRPLLARDRIGRPAVACQELLRLADECVRGIADPDWPARMQSLSQEIAMIRAEERKHIIEQTARGLRGPAEALHLLDAHRWLDRVAHHVWRACVYLTEGQLRQEEAGAQYKQLSPDPAESALGNAQEAPGNPDAAADSSEKPAP